MKMIPGSTVAEGTSAACAELEESGALKPPHARMSPTQMHIERRTIPRRLRARYVRLFDEGRVRSSRALAVGIAVSH
jgi:hypothetical protein